ncbi:MAG: undecaprenyl diphosphate synthase family protein, partial [Lentisphaeraceae bacterium]|nr:undecaprenyl diphosphate synthase family protein [Lentisphaeraceae bacterium]
MTSREPVQNKAPQHIAIIMDGNGRWAQARGEHRLVGHQAGVKSVLRTVDAAAKNGVKYLTLYTFSTENWNRPETEVSGLMDILVASIQ